MSNTMLDWALWYQKQGLSIIPVSGKVPLIPWKEYQERCASEEEIKAWWEKWPEADIGMVCGNRWDRFVIDIDGSEGVRQMLEFDLHPTIKVRTKRGYQLHYKYPKSFEGKTTLAGILPGVDTRGEGGYVKLPPSKFSDGSGRYTWENNTQLEMLPSVFLDCLKAFNKPKVVDKESGESWLEEKLKGLKNGNRNSTFTSIAGSLRSRGYSSSDIYTLLREKAEGVEFSLEELRTITESVGSYTPKTVVQETQSITEFLKDEQKVDWLVPGLIAKRSIGFIAGLPETSKTWCMMDLAIEVAKGGGKWLGKFPVNAGKVLFVDQERFKGETQRRFKNLISGKTDITSITALNVKSGSTTRLNFQPSFDAFKRELLEMRPDLVIVDSFATFHTVAENDRTEIQKVLELVKQLRNEIGCTFMFINHEGKSVLNHEPGEVKAPNAADMMGSIGVPAAAEVVFSVRRKDEDSCMVYQTKNTLSAKVPPFQVSVIDVPEGIKVVAS